MKRQTLDGKIYDVAEAFSSPMWRTKNIYDTWLSMTPRQDNRYPEPWVIMWSGILAWYFLSTLYLPISVGIIVITYYLYQYCTSYSRTRDGRISIWLDSGNIICTGAHGLDKTRMKRICHKFGFGVIFRKATNQ